MTDIIELNKLLINTTADSILRYFIEEYGDEVVFSSSFSVEDQVVTHMLSGISKRVKIFTLDTGRLPEETYKLIERTEEHFGINIDIYFPDNKLVEEMVAEKGVNLFYNSVENRKRCCQVRKVESLKRALTNYKVWITGLRREQSVTRENINPVDYDRNFNIKKINPLYKWTEKDVWDFIKKNNVPYNSLYDKNYTSIGCAPCTRAVSKGEDIRAGRWWWENPDSKECGLHINK